MPRQLTTEDRESISQSVKHDRLVQASRKLARIVKHVDGLACPRCKKHLMAVVYTRHRAASIRRVRKCKACGRRVVTVERIG